MCCEAWFLTIAPRIHSARLGFPRVCLQAPAEEPVLVVHGRLLEPTPEEDIVRIEGLQVVDALHRRTTGKGR